MGVIWNSIKHSGYTHIELYLFSIVVFNFISSLAAHIPYHNSAVYILLIIPTSLLVTILIIFLTEFLLSRLKNYNMPKYKSHRDFWFVHYLSMTGRLIFVKDIRNITIGYSILGGALGANIGQIAILLKKMVNNRDKPTCQATLDHIFGGITRHSLESLMWATAYKYTLYDNTLLHSVSVSLFASIGYFASFLVSVPVWYLFMKVKSASNLYLPGDTLLDFTTAYDTFNDHNDHNDHNDSDYQLDSEINIRPHMTYDL